MRWVTRAFWCVLACWPGVTLLLQQVYDVDPWKLMSFGMYATPPRRPADLDVRLSVRRSAGWSEVPAVVLASEVERFRQSKQALGALADPQAILNGLTALPNVQEACVQWRAPRLDRRNSQVFFATGEARSTHVGSQVAASACAAPRAVEHPP